MKEVNFLKNINPIYFHIIFVIGALIAGTFIYDMIMLGISGDLFFIYNTPLLSFRIFLVLSGLIGLIMLYLRKPTGFFIIFGVCFFSVLIYLFLYENLRVIEFFPEKRVLMTILLMILPIKHYKELIQYLENTKEKIDNKIKMM